MSKDDVLDARFRISMTPKEAHNFIVKLSSDDEFRSRFEKNPKEVLAEHHIDFPSKIIPEYISLPPKDVLQQDLEKFTKEGKEDLGDFFSPYRWTHMFFWWLYATPAKPPLSKEGESWFV